MNIPGNLIIKNGGRVLATGTIDWLNETIENGADVIVDGGTLRVIGDIRVEGKIVHDENCTIAACYPLEEKEQKSLKI